MSLKSQVSHFIRKTVYTRQADFVLLKAGEDPTKNPEVLNTKSGIGGWLIAAGLIAIVVVLFVFWPRIVAGKTPDGTLTNTPTLTETVSEATHSPTLTPTATITPTRTLAPTKTLRATASPTPTRTPTTVVEIIYIEIPITVEVIHEIIVTVIHTQVVTATMTCTPSPTATLTNTPLPSLTSTPTPTP